jgi:alanine racemase
MKALLINKEDLRHNINVLKNLVNENYRIIAVVKGNGYGLRISRIF